MTDKKIIIDGVDVSGCSFYEDNPKYRMWETCDCMRTMVDQSGYDELAGAECKGYNCYYKQLKRAEAQCEDMFIKHTDLEMKYKQKEEECEQLRKTMHKDFCSHYVLGECSQKHHNNCVGRNQCIKDLEQECEALKAELEQETALKETYLACYKAKHEDIEGELFKLREYKKSKQASYEALQKKCNELELENRKLKTKNNELKKCYKNNSALLDFEETNTTKLVNKVMKLEKTLTEIKEIAEGEMDSKEFMVVQYMLNGNVDNKNKVLKQILQKIREVNNE